jgi:hypothetical protein
MALFEKNGTVVPNVPRQKSARWPEEVYVFTKQFVESNPCFYIQELQEHRCENFNDFKNF